MEVEAMESVGADRAKDKHPRHRWAWMEGGCRALRTIFNVLGGSGGN